jgi:hypothetical protein
VIEWTMGLVCYVVYLRMKDELPPAEEGAAEPPAAP